jgi:nucleoside-diphosphate-sugar epimerase
MSIIDSTLSESADGGAVLVLGGTSWLGGAVARHARDLGHQVTCLARGEAGTPPEGVRLVRADRDSEAAYDAVRGQSWDFVVDVARQPLHVRGAVAALAEATRHWVFVSTCSVYADDDSPGSDESARRHEPWSGDGLAPDEAYGPAKVACEDAVLAASPEATVARAGLIVGYGDRSDRFGYWPARIARAEPGEPVLVPPLDDAVQVVDVEDLAAWLVRCGEQRTSGVFNAMGDTCALGEVLDASVTAAGRSGRLVEVSDAWLRDREVEPWMGPDSLPLWLPQPEYAGFMTRSNAAARAAGLELRPLAESTRAALDWERELGLDRERRAGLSPEREKGLLADV